MPGLVCELGDLRAGVERAADFALVDSAGRRRCAGPIRPAAAFRLAAASSGNGHSWHRILGPAARSGNQLGRRPGGTLLVGSCATRTDSGSVPSTSRSSPFSALLVLCKSGESALLDGARVV